MTTPERASLLGCVVAATAVLWALIKGPDVDRRSSHIATIDVGALTGKGRPEAIAQLAAVARDAGVARLVNHDVDVASARERAKLYFSLPVAQKGCDQCTVRNASVGFQRGYVPFASESGLGSVQEVKEGFCYGFEWPSSRPSEHPHQAANAWPGGEAAVALGNAWRPGMVEFFNDNVGISSALVDALAEPLGRRGDELREKAVGGETISQMRLFHYLSPDGSCERETCMGSSPHTDWHLITLISRDKASTLEVFDRRAKEWVRVASEEGELVLLVGDWLAAHSRGEYHAPLHRVLSPTAGSSLSYVFFYNPGIGATLHAEAMTSADVGQAANTVESSMYEIPWGDYMVRKWARVMGNR